MFRVGGLEAKRYTTLFGASRSLYRGYVGEWEGKRNFRYHLRFRISGLGLPRNIVPLR